MRAEGVLKVILNVYIVPGMPAKLRDDKYIEVIACEKPPEFTKFLFKLGNKETAKSFFDSILEVMPEADKNASEEKTDTQDQEEEVSASKDDSGSGEEERPEEQLKGTESPRKE